MSWLSSGIKAVGKAVGKVTGAKVLGVPVGAAFGAAAGGLPGLIEGELERGGGVAGLKKNLPGDLLAGAKNVPLALGVSKLMPGGVTTTGGPSPAVDSNGEPITTDPAYTPGGSSKPTPDGGWMKVVGDFVKDHGMDLAKLGLGAGAAYEGYENTKHANDLSNKALSLNANPNAPDLSSIFANPSNPYAKNRRVPGSIPAVGGSA